MAPKIKEMSIPFTDGEEHIVPVKQTFEHKGLLLCIHRSIIHRAKRRKKIVVLTNSWTVSEYMTGTALALFCRTIAIAKEATIRKLDARSKQVITQAINQFKKVNKKN